MLCWVLRHVRIPRPIIQMISPRPKLESASNGPYNAKPTWRHWWLIEMIPSVHKMLHENRYFSHARRNPSFASIPSQMVTPLPLRTPPSYNKSSVIATWAIAVWTSVLVCPVLLARWAPRARCSGRSWSDNVFNSLPYNKLAHWLGCRYPPTSFVLREVSPSFLLEDYMVRAN